MAELVRRLRWPRLLPVVFVFLPALLAGGVHGARALDDGRARDKEADLIHATVSRMSVAVREGGGHPGGGHGGGGGTGGHGHGGGGHGRPEPTSYHNRPRRSAAPGREVAGPSMAANCALLAAAAAAFALLILS
ncbi:hypothetical protein GUJ93_ZPchr0007g5086 [Zizania palustris]|uniref:Uncharacterized protein n=1 Tax=Zizania palustris TaxID=103762 RepID=A0A8J5T6A8_ZIZPA|nr:hypothetical protein GUJ93_ZPchr0007g5086 [Zizania palustris]